MGKWIQIRKVYTRHVTLVLQVHGQQYDVYVVYNHNHDDDFVQNVLLPLLERYEITHVNEDCWVPGWDKFTCLQNIITQSRSALVIITKNFLQENWKLYQLNQAICTEIEQLNFKVVFLLCQKPATLGELPENLRLFLRVGSTVKEYRKNWKSRLIYELKHRTKRAVSKRLTFGSRSFRDTSSSATVNMSFDSSTDDDEAPPGGSGENSIEVGARLQVESKPISWLTRY